MEEHAAAGHERDVHVRALADVAVLVDEDAVVEALLLRLHLHEHVRQIVGRLCDRVERRLDRIGRRHHANAFGVVTLRIREAAEDHHEETGFGILRGRELQAPRS